MKLRPLKLSICLALCLATCLVNVACQKSSASKKLAVQAAARARLDWNVKTLVDAYQQAGHTNPKWDEPAKLALNAFASARSRVVALSESWDSVVSNNCAVAVDADCDDPMIRILYIRLCLDRSSSKKAFADAYCDVAQAMQGSSYPAIRKFYAWQRAGQQVSRTYGYGTNVPPEVRQLGIWGQAEADLTGALSERTMPDEEIYDASHELLEIWRGSKDHYASLYQKIEGQFPDHWEKSPAILLLKGQAYREMAWHARGGGYADKVTDEGWKLFAERLAVAEQALSRAWNLNTNDARIADEMIQVELGQGQGRNRMELWFHRAMAVDPKDYDACYNKLYYLNPKWYGSASDMLAFGHECVQSTQWGGHIPLILVDAHVALQQFLEDPAQKAKYWKQPAVWQDLKDAFDRFFELNPDATSWYHNYARYAYLAGQWETFNELIPKLEPVNYDYFGGRDEFEKMVALAKKRAGESTAKD